MPESPIFLQYFAEKIPYHNTVYEWFWDTVMSVCMLTNSLLKGLSDPIWGSIAALWP